jgi:hypothetical protein
MSIVVLLYSKYSKHSTELLKLMEGVLDYRKVCIDNEDIRRAVIRDEKNYNIKEVPCIFVIFSNGRMDKFEGVDAFEWVRETLNSMRRLSEDLLTPSPPPAPPSSPLHTPLPAAAVAAPFTDVTGFDDMSRSMDTTPLVIEETKEVPPPVEEEPAIMKGIKKTDGSIRDIAAQLQAQREKEEETAHPNALSKIVK